MHLLALTRYHAHRTVCERFGTGQTVLLAEDGEYRPVTITEVPTIFQFQRLSCVVVCALRRGPGGRAALRLRLAHVRIVGLSDGVCTYIHNF